MGEGKPKIEKEFIKELTSIFNEIDNRILSLHECSSEDFLLFNEKLKKFNEIVKKINNNANLILDSIDSDSTSELFTQLYFLQYKIKTYVNTYDKIIDSKIEMLENLSSKINSMFLPLKNYKQNLITLKYLIANSKLNFAYDFPQAAVIINKEINEIDNSIRELIGIFPSFEKGVEELKSKIYMSILSFKNFKDNSTINSTMVLHQTDYSLKLLNIKHSGIVQQTNALRKRTNNCTNKVSHIITNLQFHDIIRQKIEHIQSTNKNIIEKFLSTDNASLEVNKLAQGIKEIAELQIAQLTHTNQKYQTAIDVIIQNFSDIANSLYHEAISYGKENNDAYELPFSDIEKELLSGIGVVNKLVDAIDDFFVKIKDINEALNKLELINEKVLSKKNNLNVLVNKFLQNNSNSNTDKYVEMLLNFIQTEQSFVKHIDSLQKLFTDICTEVNMLIIDSNDNKPLPEFKDVVLSTGQGASRLVNKLATINKEVAQNISQNKEYSANVVNEIKKSLNEVKYYDYFEKVMEQEVIFKLNSIYKELTKNIKVSTDSNSELFVELQSIYTMQSERIIHKDIDCTIGLDDNAKDDNIVNDDDNIEFF